MARTPADDTHPVRPGCEAWSSPGGGPHGALVLHGFTGSPVSMRPVGEALAAAGLAVELPRLPGHGTDVADLIPTTFDDWLAEAERALGALRARVPDGRIVVVGLSMGGALTVALAERHDDLAGIVAINTPVSISDEMRGLVQQLLDGGMEVMDSIGNDIAAPGVDEGSYDQTPLRPLLSLIEAGDELRARLGDVRCPVLVITSRQDHVVPPTDSDVLAESVGGPVERVWLERSYHVATLDFDAELVCQATVDFAARVTTA
ncbi:MAG TPA: alpha/beta fold hydrolase [Acidimicrobiales bacterium]|nr:alpha/beta fold hydrolase [Acidimicrobiales bacterium]